MKPLNSDNKKNIILDVQLGHNSTAALGIGGLLNTSFNLHRYKLVAYPEQAFITFKNSGLRYLSMGTHFIEKTNSNF